MKRLVGLLGVVSVLVLYGLTAGTIGPGYNPKLCIPIWEYLLYRVTVGEDAIPWSDCTYGPP